MVLHGDSSRVMPVPARQVPAGSTLHTLQLNPDGLKGSPPRALKRPHLPERGWQL